DVVLAEGHNPCSPRRPNGNLIAEVAKDVRAAPRLVLSGVPSKLQSEEFRPRRIRDRKRRHHQRQHHGAKYLRNGLHDGHLRMLACRCPRLTLSRAMPRGGVESAICRSFVAFGRSKNHHLPHKSTKISWKCFPPLLNIENARLEEESGRIRSSPYEHAAGVLACHVLCRQRCQPSLKLRLTGPHHVHLSRSLLCRNSPSPACPRRAGLVDWGEGSALEASRRDWLVQ